MTRLNGERVRVRGGHTLRAKNLPLTPTLSPLSAKMGRGGRRKMTVTAMKTKAEEQLAEHFARAADALPGSGWVPAARNAAFAAFAAAGLPHRRIEAWKYTDLRAGLKEAYPPAKCSATKLDDSVLRQALGPELAELACIRLVLVNGRYVAKMIPTGHEPGTSYHFESLAGALGRPASWIEQHFAIAGSNVSADPVLALNAAFATDGIVLRVAKDARLTLPIHIVSIADPEAPTAVAIRHLLKIDAGARATIIESHVGLGAVPWQAMAVTQIAVAAGGEAHHIKHIASGAAHLGRLDVEIAADAIYRGFQFTSGTGLVRNESHVSFTGPDAKFDLSGAFLGRDSDHIDTTLVLRHSTTGCESRELFKGVLAGRARGVFQGKVIVEPQAQKTDGKQMAQALMLSEDAEFDSKPELEIYADDVACGHGSTAAEIDPAMLFYLRSRGIPEPEARAMLIESFIGEAIDKVDDEAIREALMSEARRWLGRLPPAVTASGKR